MHIRRVRNDDTSAIAEIVMPVFREGTTYAINPKISEHDALAYWLGGDKTTFVALDDDMSVIGTYYIRPNQDGGGRHVCNCGYITSSLVGGRGVARKMCEHSKDYAREVGFKAMQFNFVTSTNERAIRLWRSLGFEIVGTLPGAFEHPNMGFVDAYVMYQWL